MENIQGNYNSTLGSTSNLNVAGEVDEFGIGRRESYGVMIERFYADMSDLIQKESLLIKTEISEKFTELKAASASIAIGGTLLFVGVFSLVATAIILLDRVMPLWGAAALVTVLLFVVGGVLLSGAIKRISGDKMKLTHSAVALSEISTTLKERVHEFTQH